MTQNLWSQYARHFVGITWHNVLSWWVFEDLPCYSNKISTISSSEMTAWSLTYWKKDLSDIKVTNIPKSCTYKMEVKTSWHGYGMKLHHCHPAYPRHIMTFGRYRLFNICKQICTNFNFLTWIMCQYVAAHTDLLGRVSYYYQCLYQSNVMHKPHKLNTDSNRNTKILK